MTSRERNELLETAVLRDPGDPFSRRFNVRRLSDGKLEFYDFKLTEVAGDEPVFHGHPATRVPGKVLRVLRADEKITTSEYNRFRKELG